ncbi:ABC transporter ATP-binding protein [Nocardia asiatica]
MSRRQVRTADHPPDIAEKLWEKTVGNAIDVDDVVKTYPVAGGEFVAVDHISLQIPEGEFVAIVGRSGSGKTALLNMLAGIDRTTPGTIRTAGADLGSLSESGFAAWRGANVGLVFQFFQLLSTLTVAENVMLAMDFVRKIPVSERHDRARTLLERVGIGAHPDKLPATLSGGQQQRAAIARALANDPPLILADEPTDLNALLGNGLGTLFFSAPLPFRISLPAVLIWTLLAILGATLATEAAASRASRVTVCEALAYL